MSHLSKSIFLFSLLFILLVPSIILAASTYTAKRGNTSVTVCYEGLVPCGLGKPYWENASVDSNGHCTGGVEHKEGVACQFCHFFILINAIVNYFFIYIVPPVAVLMLVIGGIMFYFSGGSPNLVSRGKSLVKAVIIGLFVLYGSYVIVGFFLSVFGLAQANPVNQILSKGGFSINCQVELPTAPPPASP